MSEHGPSNTTASGSGAETDTRVWRQDCLKQVIDLLRKS